MPSPARLQSGAHARHGAVVIPALDVDRARESALPFGHVIGDVGHEVRVAAVGLPHDAILVVAEVGRPQPQRTVLLVRAPRGDETLAPSCRPDRRCRASSRGSSCRSGTPKATRSRSCSLRSSATANLRIVSISPRSWPTSSRISLRELANVLAAIAVFGKRRVLTQDLLRARAHRHREILDLLAGVVVVELARHLSALATRAAWRWRRPAPPAGRGRHGAGRSGFADTNSTMTRSPSRMSLRPKLSRAERISPTIAGAPQE